MAPSDANTDDAAWLLAVVRQYESQLLQYAARLLGDVHRARDVAQDTFLQLCKQPRARVERDVRPWLFAVCRNRASDVLRKERRMRTIGEDQGAQLAVPDGDPSAAIERRETVGRISAILDTLPANQREAIRLKVQHGMSYREISEVTGLSVSNVGFLLHKGLATIRERLAKST